MIKIIFVSLNMIMGMNEMLRINMIMRMNVMIKTNIIMRRNMVKADERDKDECDNENVCDSDDDRARVIVGMIVTMNMMVIMKDTVASAPPPRILELQDGFEAGPEPHPLRSTRTESKYLQEQKNERNLTRSQSSSPLP